MKVFFALFLVILVAFAGYHLSFRRVGGRHADRRFQLTGLEFLVLGLLLGPLFLNILDADTCRSLEPLSAMMLGWIGLLFGFQFEFPKLRQFPPAFFLASLLESAVTLGIVFTGVWLLLPVFIDMATSVRVATAAALASAAACSAPTGLALLSADILSARSKLVRLLRYMASVDGLLPVLLLGAAFLYRLPVLPESVWMGGISVLAASVGALLLYLLFLAQRRDIRQLALVIIGLTVLVSGAATLIGFSPLVANFVIGVCLVNITREKEKIFNLLVSIEKPVYLMLLIFLGAAWQLAGIWMILPAVAYAALRFGGKMTGGLAVTRVFPLLRDRPGSLGLGLLEQGGLPLAVLFDFHQGFAGGPAGYAIGFALIAITVNDVFNPYFLSILLKR